MKLQAEAYNFIKKEALAQVFSCEFCSANQWIGFYMITAPVMKELIELLNSSDLNTNSVIISTDIIKKRTKILFR